MTNFLSKSTELLLKDNPEELKKFVKGLPKCELHIHIEGSLEPEQMLSFAKRNNISLSDYNGDDEQFCKTQRKKRNFNNLQEFLNLYYEACDVLKTEKDFYDLCYSYLEKARKDNVKHCEIFFDPQTHMYERNKLDLSVILNGLSSACNQAKLDFNISAQLILCFLRHRSEEEALDVLDQLINIPNYKKLVLGVGLDSGEAGNPPENFQKVFTKAKEAGLRLTAHAGEEAGPDYIEQALDVLQVERIDHGVRCLESEHLVERLSKEKVLLTVCPSSNHRLQVVKRYFASKSPIGMLLEKNVPVCLNGDDPAYFFGHVHQEKSYGGYIAENYLLAAVENSLTGNQLASIAINGFQGSFLPADEKMKFCNSVEDYCVKFQNSFQSSKNNCLPC
eukprot:maker-scaffold_90-snap-gene-0.35-mRNA-1 protein AED:0.02 eAED:0.02 QI:95/1/1/1/1/1/3/117/390